jgi:hypothetical protein
MFGQDNSIRSAGFPGNSVRQKRARTTIAAGWFDSRRAAGKMNFDLGKPYEVS